MRVTEIQYPSQIASSCCVSEFYERYWNGDQVFETYCLSITTSFLHGNVRAFSVPQVENFSETSVSMRLDGRRTGNPLRRLSAM